MSELENIPKEIYINVGDDEHCEIDFNFDDLTDVTWCTHAIDDNDIKYYLADDVDKHIKDLKQRNKELEAIVTNIQATIDYLHYDDRKITVRQLKQLLKGGE